MRNDSFHEIEPIQRWLYAHDFTPVRAVRLVGGFAATLWRIRALTGDRRELRLVYKRCALDRASEIEWLKRMLPLIQDFAPPILALVDTADEKGILMKDLGPSLKSTFDVCSTSEQRQLLECIARRLAQLHIQFSETKWEWPQRSVVKPYPIESAALWSRQSMASLAWCMDRNLVQGLHRQDIDGLQSMTDHFYAVYEQYLDTKTTLTHGDTHLQNFVGQAGTLFLIDWEFAHIAPPQRDLAILMQDIMDEGLQDYVREVYFHELQSAAWPVDSRGFMLCLQACLFDNTLMMLGWDVQKFRDGFLTVADLSHIVRKKLGGLRRAFESLSKS